MTMMMKNICVYEELLESFIRLSREIFESFCILPNAREREKHSFNSAEEEEEEENASCRESRAISSCTYFHTKPHTTAL
jgi:hypothetical protein